LHNRLVTTAAAKMSDFAQQLEAILKVQMEEKGEGGHAAPKFLARQINTNVKKKFDDDCSFGGWTHYLALKVSSLVPLGQLIENIGKVQEQFITELGPGVVQKTADPNDLHVKLLLLKEEQQDALNLLFATLKSLPISGTNQVEFGGLLPSKKFVTMAMFSESLESLMEHMKSHVSKSTGVRCTSPQTGLTLPQPGLFQLDVLEILRPAEYDKSSQKKKFGKYEWCTLHLVNSKNDQIVATIDIDVSVEKS